MNNPLVQPDPGLAIWTIVTFLVLLALLAKFAWRPLLRALESRQETIRKSLDDAQKARAEMEALGKESQRILRQAHVDAEAIIAGSRADAEKLREEIRLQARQDAEAVVREAQLRIETETARALRQLRGEVADLSVEIASKLIQRNFTPQDQSALIEETLRELESGPRPS
ncbi:MAG: F0F1 ATP synthase subunit B [Acidobacteriota bacterium]|jgi:F-type H+-transporting ATPase subunit b|nr:F0F1 ATP synthase subunit B [Acidobacteriota bacterium]NLT33570.1 F0F1 ATP synthase subunit B [Acidobacteriota bacterium]